MTLGARLKLLRKEIGVSQETMGAQGFVSTFQWVKIENGQRSASDVVILRFAGWLLKEKYVEAHTAGRIMEELLTLKYLGSRSAFIRRLARNHAEQLFEGTAIRLSEDPAVYRMKPRRMSRVKIQ